MIGRPERGSPLQQYHSNNTNLQWYHWDKLLLADVTNIQYLDSEKITLLHTPTVLHLFLYFFLLLRAGAR